jgi:tetratricopeptide (TPR) repeat protein
MSAILDQGSPLFASCAVVIVSLLLELRLRGSLSLSLAFLPLLGLALVYVPATLLFANLFARLGSLSVVFQRDYSPLLTCAAMAWAAVNIPIVVVAWILPFPFVGAIAILAYLYFLVLMFFAARTVLGTENRAAAATVSVSWLPLLAAPFLRGPLTFLLGWLTSPFLLLLVFFYLRAEFANLGSGMRRRQQLRRMLEAATVNPHDGDAQYQLGLIYQQRHQYTEAILRFKNAVAIDPSETDAHFQLGRIALKQGRIHDALAHFQTVFNQDEKYHSSEILRELGALYVTAGQYQDAQQQLKAYVGERPYDPEGLYYYGFALEQTGEVTEAREMYERAIEAARTSPPFRRRYTAQWSRRAQKQAGKLSRA